MAAGEGVSVKGGAQLVSTLERAGHDISDLRAGFGDAGEIVARASSAEAPRLSGALAASMVAEGGEPNTATVTSPLTYAVPVHWGAPAHNQGANPFAVRARDDTQREWMAALERDAQATCNRVKGA